MEEEIKKYAYFTFKNRGLYGFTTEVLNEHKNFLSQFPEVTYPTNFLPYHCWKVEKNLIRKLKIQNLEHNLDEPHKNFVRFMCNENLVSFYGYEAPTYNEMSGSTGTAGASGTTGTYGSSGTDGYAVNSGRGWRNPFMEIFEEII